MSPIVIEGVKWWFNNLRWTVHWASRPEHSKPHENTVTFLELVIDMEAATGMEFPGSCLSEKASRLAALLRTLARIYTLEVEGEKASWKTAFDPQVLQPTLTPLDAPRISGLSRRPRGLSSFTPAVAAANVWRALHPVQTATPTDTPAHRHDDRKSARASRTFALGHRINRSGITQHVVWRTKAEKEISLAREAALRAYYDASDKWQEKSGGAYASTPDSVAPLLAARLGANRAGTSSSTGTALRQAHGGVTRESGLLPRTISSTPSSSLLAAPKADKPDTAQKRANSYSKKADAADVSHCSPTPPHLLPCSSAQPASTSASSNGSTAVPRIASSLRELRLLHQEATASRIQTEPNLILAEANGETARGVNERQVHDRGRS